MNLIPDTLREFSFLSTIVRLLLAMLIGGAIGFEREKKRRPAGFRTYMLVALGSALAMILSQYLDFMLRTDWAETAALVGVHTDVSRFGAKVISGVGFIGAGTIIVIGSKEVKGLTTAAGLWAASSMGLAAGAGFYEAVLICLLMVILCMNVLKFFESAILAESRNMNIYVELDTIAGLGAVAAKLKSANIRLYDTEFNKEKPDSSAQIKVAFSIRLPHKMPHVEVLATVSTVDGIVRVEEF